MAAVIGVLLLPFFGTILGAGCVYFLKRPSGAFPRQGLSGLAAGVMVAASIWSLLLPALEGAAPLGKLACLPALAGLWSGIWLLIFCFSVSSDYLAESSFDWNEKLYAFYLFFGNMCALSCLPDN